MINILKALMEKVENRQEQMGNNKQRVKTLKVFLMKASKGNVREKIVTQIKNNFDGLISRFDMTEERMSKLEDRNFPEQNIQKLQGNFERVTYK